MKDNHDANDRQRVQADRIRKGFISFVLLTLGGLGILIFYTRSPETLRVFTQLDTVYLLLALGLTGVDLLVGGWRNHIFIRKLRPGTGAWLSIRANLANMFMASMTPAQSGGGVAQVYLWHRHGVPVPEGLSVTVISFLSTLIVFLFAALFGVTVVSELFPQPGLRYVIRYTFVVFALCLGLFILTLWRPEIFTAFIRLLTRALSRLRPRSRDTLERVSHRAAQEVARFHEVSRFFFRRSPGVLLINLALTFVLYLNKFTIAYFVMRGLGAEGAYLHVLAIQSLLLFIFYFAPTPGASGIAELSTGALMSVVMPGYMLPVFTIIYRALLLYIPAALGALVLMRLLANGAINKVQASDSSWKEGESG